MLWKDGLTRKNGTVMLVQWTGGREELLPLTELGKGKPSGNARKERFETNFDEWREASKNHFCSLADLGANSLRGQRVFEFYNEGTCFMVPAEALIAAFFRPIYALAPYLFMPHGLERAFSPTTEPTSLEFLGRGPKIVFRRPSIQGPTNWYWSFPSARRLWASVYEFSTKGVIGCDLPQGTARISVQGKKVARAFLVSAIRIISVRTEEQPFDFAAGASQRIVFHESDSFLGNRERCKAKIDHSIPSRATEWSLSDEEWALIEPLFPRTRGAVRRLPVRTLLDGIIAKLGTGTPWKKAAFEVGTWMNASELYQDCKRNGRWGKIHQTLARTRSQAAVPATLPEPRPGLNCGLKSCNGPESVGASGRSV